VEVIAAWFPPHATLASHRHDRPLFGLMFDGAFRTTILGREVDYDAASAWSEPAEERHANIASPRGARVLIIQPSSGHADMTAIHGAIFDEVVHLRSAELLPDAARLEAECGIRDDLSPVVVEGLALALLARAARLFRRSATHEPHPKWLLQAQEYLHAHCLERITLGALARDVGVHPSRLAHEFRIRLRVSPGEYLRRLRIAWAAARLLDEESSIADIAVRAGFYDQSHFSRLFRRQLGMPPAAWRRSHDVRDS
jgi:AraC family transcriptional regulator